MAAACPGPCAHRGARSADPGAGVSASLMGSGGPSGPPCLVRAVRRLTLPEAPAGLPRGPSRSAGQGDLSLPPRHAVRALRSLLSVPRVPGVVREVPSRPVLGSAGGALPAPPVAVPAPAPAPPPQGLLCLPPCRKLHPF